MKRWRYLWKAVVCATVMAGLLSMTGFYGACEDIRQEVFRLHILANSDSDADQQLKLRVRDALLVYTETLFRDCHNKQESMQVAQAHLEDIRAYAQTVVREAGYAYPVQVSVTNMPFNTRVYDGVTLPAGKYDALRVVIGSGQGHNWWCVLYPALCLPSVQREALSGVVSDGEEALMTNSDTYEVKFILVEWWEGLCALFA